jgi:hypothetical protein
MSDLMERAREVLSVRTLTAVQMEDLIPTVAAALLAVQRETSLRCREIAINGVDSAELTGNVQYGLGCDTIAELIAEEFELTKYLTQQESGEPRL